MRMPAGSSASISSCCARPLLAIVRRPMGEGERRVFGHAAHGPSRPHDDGARADLNEAFDPSRLRRRQHVAGSDDVRPLESFCRSPQLEHGCGVEHHLGVTDPA